MRTGTVVDADASIVMRVDVMADDLIGTLTRTVNGVVLDVGVSADVDADMWVTVIAVLEFIALLLSLEGLLLFSRTACRCWLIADLGFCALQAWIPSYHVC